jgi:hypothetical protein
VHRHGRLPITNSARSIKRILVEPIIAPRTASIRRRKVGVPGELGHAACISCFVDRCGTSCRGAKLR